MPISSHEALFDLRRAIARVGESDRLKWWESHALGDAGQYAAKRIFLRTLTLSTVHVAITAARVRHDAVVPNEPLIHLFNFGERYEGTFERWLIQRKVDSWEPGGLKTADGGGVANVFSNLGIEPAALANLNGTSAVALGSVPADNVQSADERLRIAHRLAAAYVASKPERLIVPYLRIES